MKQIYPVTVLVMLSITACLALIGGHPSAGKAIDKTTVNAAQSAATLDASQAPSLASR